MLVVIEGLDIDWILGSLKPNRLYCSWFVILVILLLSYMYYCSVAWLSIMLFKLETVAR